MNDHPLKIAVASGKGGTGKTTVATSLAAAVARQDPSQHLLFLDCDVEAPNAHFYLKPDLNEQKTACMQIPSIDKEKCTYCGLCAQICQFKAIAVVGKNLLVFPQLCHSCGACGLVCPTGTITDVEHPIGVLESGTGVENIHFARGVLNIGEPMAKPIITQLKAWAAPQAGQTAILDAPPGTTCSVVETIRGADYLLLVTEPTPFGHHDLKLMLELGRMMKIRHGVIINRYGVQNDSVESLCEEYGVPMLFTIPFQRLIAEGISQGKLLIDILPAYTQKFIDLFEEIRKDIGKTNKPDNIQGKEPGYRGEKI